MEFHTLYMTELLYFVLFSCRLNETVNSEQAGSTLDVIPNLAHIQHSSGYPVGARHPGIGDQSDLGLRVLNFCSLIGGVECSQRCEEDPGTETLLELKSTPL